MSIGTPTYKSVRAMQLASPSRLPLTVGSPSGTIGGVQFGAGVRRGINANLNATPAITQSSAKYASTLARLTKLAKLSQKNAAIWAGSHVGDYVGGQLAQRWWMMWHADKGYNLPENMFYDASLGELSYYGMNDDNYAAPSHPATKRGSSWYQNRLDTISVPSHTNWAFYTTWDYYKWGLYTYYQTYTLPEGAVPQPVRKPQFVPDPYVDVPTLPNGQPEPMPDFMPRRMPSHRIRRKDREEPYRSRMSSKKNSISYHWNGTTNIGVASSSNPNKKTTDTKATGSLGAIMSFMGHALDWSSETLEVMEILYDHAGIDPRLSEYERTKEFFLNGGWQNVDDWTALFFDLLANVLTDKYIYGPFFGAVSKQARKNGLAGYSVWFG